jgi:hypothetical protein
MRARLDNFYLQWRGRLIQQMYRHRDPARSATNLSRPSVPFPMICLRLS